jgi:hypothetical protein
MGPCDRHCRISLRVQQNVPNTEPVVKTALHVLLVPPRRDRSRTKPAHRNLNTASLEVEIAGSTRRSLDPNLSAQEEIRPLG